LYTRSQIVCTHIKYKIRVMPDHTNSLNSDKINKIPCTIIINYYNFKLHVTFNPDHINYIMGDELAYSETGIGSRWPTFGR